MINSSPDPVTVQMAMAFDSDFAHLFEVKDRQFSKKGTIIRRAYDDHVELIYRREAYERRTVIRWGRTSISSIPPVV